MRAHGPDFVFVYYGFFFVYPKLSSSRAARGVTVKGCMTRSGHVPSRLQQTRLQPGPRSRAGTPPPTCTRAASCDVDVSFCPKRAPWYFS